jgi:hypothetical protein
MLLVPPLAALPRKKLSTMPTNITKIHRQPTLKGWRSRGQEPADFSKNESSVRLIQD